MSAEAGIRQFSKSHHRYGHLFVPFLSRLPRKMPGVWLSTIKAEMPPAPLISGFVRAMTVNTPA